jgi:hypothetical protein
MGRTQKMNQLVLVLFIYICMFVLPLFKQLLELVCEMVMGKCYTKLEAGGECGRYDDYACRFKSESILFTFLCYNFLNDYFD